MTPAQLIEELAEAAQEGRAQEGTPVVFVAIDGTRFVADRVTVAEDAKGARRVLVYLEPTVR